MNQTYFFISIGVGLLALLFWLVLSRRPHGHEESQEPHLPLEDLAPRNALYISHIRTALSDTDLEYLQSRVPAKSLQRVKKERRRVAREFLAGLGDDYRRLDRMARVVAALSPKVEYKQEIGRVCLALRFHALYALVWARISVGPAPVEALAGLAGLVGSLSARIEAAMDALAEKSAAAVVVNL